MPARVGLSGFASPSLRSVIHPERRTAEELLAEYSHCFDAVEMDSSFVRFPSRDTVTSWAHHTPASFTFTVHMSRDVTHVTRLGMPRAVSQTLSVLAPLGPRLGCVLFTTPPTMACDVDSFRAVLDRIPEGLSTAWEFHHGSWLCPEIVDLLCENGSAPVVVDRLDGITGVDLLPRGDMAEKWDLPFLYVRLRRDRYVIEDILEWGRVLREATVDGRSVYVFFKQSPESPAYALALAELLAESAPARQAPA